MNILVTGCAGFIGSHLSERLIKEGYNVIGIDSFEDYYPRWIKEKNIKYLLKNQKFKLIEKNLLSDNLFDFNNISTSFRNIKYIFHLAAQAGVRKSWGKDFQIYAKNNIIVTQKLLEFAKEIDIKKFVYASSSSVYGNVQNIPVQPIKENIITTPISPYGVSKLAGENLCYLYWKNFKIPIVSLRYFTVYGPRQRPDMAFHKFIKKILKDEKINIFGDGSQTRDFTFVSDIVEANLLALNAPSGEIFNIGGGKRYNLIDTLHLIEDLLKKRAKINKINTKKGDVHDTWADINKAREILKYNPRHTLKYGIKKEIDWIKEVYKDDK